MPSSIEKWQYFSKLNDFGTSFISRKLTFHLVIIKLKKEDEFFEDNLNNNIEFSETMRYRRRLLMSPCFFMHVLRIQAKYMHEKNMRLLCK